MNRILVFLFFFILYFVSLLKSKTHCYNENFHFLRMLTLKNWKLNNRYALAATNWCRTPKSNFYHKVFINFIPSLFPSYFALFWLLQILHVGMYTLYKPKVLVVFFLFLLVLVPLSILRSFLYVFFYFLEMSFYSE